MRNLMMILMACALVSCASTRGPANQAFDEKQLEFERSIQVQSSTGSARIH